MGILEWFRGEEPGLIDTLLHYENKGQYGEYATEFALTHDNVAGYSRTLTNVYLPYRGSTSEVDVLMVHEKGIFVFESKNYSGWIYGSAEQTNWTQCFPNREKLSFYNPVRQNQTHCRALADFLNIPVTGIASYIIFSNHCELKSVPGDTPMCKIVQRRMLLPMLRQDLAYRGNALSREQVNQIAGRLSQLTMVSAYGKAQHVSEIKNRMEGDTCPFCGGNLVLRSGSYGSFYGCAGYPKCKFTRKLR